MWKLDIKFKKYNDVYLISEKGSATRHSASYSSDPSKLMAMKGCQTRSAMPPIGKRQQWG